VSDTFPILLRPPIEVAQACAAQAQAEGVSRNEWITRTLEAALEEAGHRLRPATPEDVPLPGV